MFDVLGAFSQAFFAFSNDLKLGQSSAFWLSIFVATP